MNVKKIYDLITDLHKIAGELSQLEDDYGFCREIACCRESFKWQYSDEDIAWAKEFDYSTAKEKLRERLSQALYEIKTIHPDFVFIDKKEIETVQELEFDLVFDAFKDDFEDTINNTIAEREMRRI